MLHHSLDSELGPHRILKERSFTSEKPRVSHFRVFGCPVYIHVLEEKRTKLKPSSLKGIVV
jgi:hypothetical protein